MDMHETGRDTVRHSSSANRAVRSIVSLTTDKVMLAGEAVDLLGHLAALNGRLPQALDQVSQGLGRSLDDYQVFERDGEVSAVRTAAARRHLAHASELAELLGLALADARSELLQQAYVPPGFESGS